MFALVDCNNFYASCERIFQPQLEGKPIAILSNNDGCVIARSNEAKALGLPMGAPAFKYKHFFKTHQVRVFSSNYPLYGDMSGRIMSVLKQFTPKVEVYSIDEAFLQFEGFDRYDLGQYGMDVKKRVRKWTGMPVSIGVAPSKALAKVANKIAKKFSDKTQGVYVIDSDEKRIKALKWTKIEDVWGIGNKHSKRLQLQNVHTAYDFTQLPDAWVRKEMSVVGLRLKKDLEGEATLLLEEGASSKKAIATTRSFDKNVTQLADLKERVSTFASLCAEKLRRQQSSCHLIYVFVRSNPFQKNQPQYRNGQMITLPFATHSSLRLSQSAVKVVEKLYRPGIQYKKAGVIVMGLVPSRERQLDLFSEENPKHDALMQAIDSVHKKYGRHKIKIANQNLRRTFAMKQAHLSPQYTTHIDDIIRIK